MYRKRHAICKRMREAKERKHLKSPAPDYPVDLPKLRRQVIVRDFDYGEVEYVFNLYKSNRIDCYIVEVDGNMIAARKGWSSIMVMLRTAFPRVSVL